jgi:hypothetical protein
MATTPGSVQMTFELDDQFPLVTLVTMIAPSPDWFVGVHGLPLFENGEWIGKTVIDLRPYDAGTDSGVTFTSANAVTSPREPIHELSDTFPFQGTGPLGTFTFLRLVNGDLNESGDLDVGDLDDLSQALREDRTESRWDVNGDQQVNAQDRIYWIEQLRGTTFGDANLDGSFNSGDLLTVFQAGQYRDDVVGNSGWMQGDWDGDGEFDTSDLLVAFQRGGYEVAGATAVASVPEPSALFLTATGIGLLAVRRRRSMAAGTRTIN